MKKLLSILGAMTVVFSSMSSVVACNNDNSSWKAQHETETKEIVDNANALKEKGNLIVYNQNWKSVGFDDVKKLIVSRLLDNFDYGKDFSITGSSKDFVKISDNYKSGSIKFSITDKTNDSVLTDSNGKQLFWTINFITSQINDINDVFQMMNNVHDNTYNVNISNYTSSDFISILKAFGIDIDKDSPFGRFINLFENGLGKAFRQLMVISAGIPRTMPQLDWSNKISTGKDATYNMLQTDGWKRFQGNIVSVLRVALNEFKEDSVTIKLDDVKFAGMALTDLNLTININEFAESIAPDMIHIFNFIMNKWSDGCNISLLLAQYLSDKIQNYSIDAKGDTDGFANLNYKANSSEHYYEYNITSMFGDIFGRAGSGTSDNDFDEGKMGQTWNEKSGSNFGWLHESVPPVDFKFNSDGSPEESWKSNAALAYNLLDALVQNFRLPEERDSNPLMNLLPAFYDWKDIQNGKTIDYSFILKLGAGRSYTFKKTIIMLPEDNQKVWDNIMHSWLNSYYVDHSISGHLSFDFVKGDEKLEYFSVAANTWKPMTVVNGEDYDAMDPAKCKDLRIHFTNLQIKVKTTDSKYGDVSYLTDPGKLQDLYVNLNIQE